MLRGSLYRNRIGDAGAKEIGSALKDNNTLVILKYVPLVLFCQKDEPSV